MEITQELLDKYIGGQLILVSVEGGYLTRGEINKIELRGQFGEQELWMSFSWVSRNTGRPNAPTYDWVRVDEPRELFFKISDREVADEGDGRISFWYPVLAETATLILPNDETKVMISDLRMIYTYAICRTSDDARSRLICCLNSQDLPPFNPENIVLEVSDRLTFGELPMLKARLWEMAQEQGIGPVSNLEPAQSQPQGGV